VSDDTGKLERLSDDVKSSWHRFLDTFEPLRPELYRYCRALTGTPWDAEDLAAETLMRAFVTLGTLFTGLPKPRAWLFRVASNLWIDRVRRAHFETVLDSLPEPAVTDADPREPRDAARQLLGRLAPQERVAVLLKEAFDFSIEEIATTLATSSGAVKAALHRGRTKLMTAEPQPSSVPPPGVLDAFCEAFNARDLERMTALLLEGASVEIVAVVTEYGQDAPKDPRTGSFTGSLAPMTIDERGGVPVELLAGYLPLPPRCEIRAYRDGFVLVCWFEHQDGPAVRTLLKVEHEGDRIRRVRNYFFSPDVIAEICAELGLPYRANGYRFWHRAP
jgi:RNA polymerase sigma-70 factor (ECF subfamily)